MADGYGFQAAFEANAKLQDERHVSNQATLVRIEAKVDHVSARQDRTDEVLEGLERLIGAFSKKNLAAVGSVFGVVSVVASVVSRLIS